MNKLITLLAVLLVGFATAQIHSTPVNWDEAKASATTFFDANFLANEQVAFEINSTNEIHIGADDIEDGAVFEIRIPVSNTTGRPLHITGTVAQLMGNLNPYYTFSGPANMALAGNSTGDLSITLTFGTVPNNIKASGASIRFTTNIYATATDAGTGNSGSVIYVP